MKFSCNGCGWCCKNFGDLGWLPVYNWEKEFLETKAKERGISLKFVPVDLILDKRTNSAICFQFGMKNEPCPFLTTDNKCSIYESRPLVCRAYPLAQEVLLRDPPKFDLSSFGHCENLDVKELMIKHFGVIEGIENKMKKSEMVRKYIEAFGYDPLISIEKGGILKRLADMQMKNLITNRIVKLRKIGKYDYDKYQPIDILSFFKKINSDNENFIDNTVNQIISGNFVREQIDGLLEGEESSQ